MEPAPTQSAAPVIEMQEVAIGALREPSLVLAEGVNWRVMPGDYWAVAGLHGSGKSDFLMTTAGWSRPWGGDYKLFGEPMPIFDDARLKTRLRMGLAFDNGQLFNHLTVAENVALPANYHEGLPPTEVSSQVQSWLEAMELTPWAGRLPSSIGRNWQKRVGLARALVLRPELLLVDDPLAGLDPRHTNWW